MIEYYWRPGCPFCMMLSPQMRSLGVEVSEFNIWEDPDAAERVRAVADGNETVPTVIIGEKGLVNPSINEVRELIASQDPETATDLAKPPLWQRILGAK
jgi:glutaredoxin